ncbi:hypothetical protein A2W14_05590 [Candidatus Gottesmanbacteria bacterium RBG_16_37_8]|uniref:Uncharacterized protein n=1 Tax=Candidatus Gottesmanbacteria bacterium RBG_16_37_8 TaxID=1798371 RepID=A0A1F5YV14_9BACT|nr:MAG: hypothetical protein A2W14_05590 [Candidatus Gottesmanbacteria bacterium RBG_16_37_8]
MSRLDGLVNLIIIPLYILKLIGELLITTAVYIFSAIWKTYKLFLFLLKEILLLPRRIFIWPFNILSRLESTLGRKSLPEAKVKELLQNKKKKNRALRKRLRFAFIKARYFLLGILFLGVIVIYYQINSFVASLPNPQQIKLAGFPATTKIFDRNEILLYEIYEGYDRTPITLSEIPKQVIEATIAIEDQEFYLHNGVSLRGIGRAIIHNLTSDSLEGGSTITQQLIRSTYLNPEKTILRKLKEIILSIRAEQIYSKNQILEMYFNQVPYGGTAWGIEAASKTYFNKKTSELNLAEASFLAGLPANPSKYQPFGNKDNNYKKRQEEVLKRMLNEGFISNYEYTQAISYPFNFIKPRMPIAAPHFVMYIREILNKYYGPRLTETGGLRVYTTLDLNLQEQVQKIVSSEIENLKDLAVSNGATLITQPNNGEILAMVGSADYFNKDNDGNVNVVLSLRQPGSSIKVVNYAAALQKGYTPASIINDSPVSFMIAGQPAYRPVNYDGKFHGRVTLRTALASSYNVPAVKVLNSIGVKKMIETGKKMGIDSWSDEQRFGLSLTLGGGEVTMIDMAEVYGTLANGGIRQNLTPFIKITDLNGKNIPLPNTEKPTRTIPETVAYILSSILSDNEARTPAFGRNSLLNIPGKTIAVKTGTSDNKRDNWTIGYTPDLVVTVWVGNNDNSPMNPRLTSGVTGAAPMWREIMELLSKDKAFTPFIKPPGLITIKCNQRDEYFIEGTITENPCQKLPTEAVKISQ